MTKATSAVCVVKKVAMLVAFVGLPEGIWAYVLEVFPFRQLLSENISYCFPVASKDVFFVIRESFSRRAISCGR